MSDPAKYRTKEEVEEWKKRDPIEQIKSIPAFLGEVDLLKTIQLLPGIRNAGEGSAGLYVRGGGPDQNLILLDDAPVYNTGHLFGFFSIFNSDAIKNVSLIKGGIILLLSPSLAIKTEPCGVNAMASGSIFPQG